MCGEFLIFWLHFLDPLPYDLSDVETAFQIASPHLISEEKDTLRNLIRKRSHYTKSSTGILRQHLLHIRLSSQQVSIINPKPYEEKKEKKK